MEDILQLVQKYFELVIEWAVLLCELIGVIMIVLTAIRGVIAWLRKDPHARLIAAEGIAIALTFKMGGEVLRTVIVREWQELLVLGAIVPLRTIMSFIIHFEIRSERQTLEGSLQEKTPEEATDEQKTKPKKRFPVIKL